MRTKLYVKFLLFILLAPVFVIAEEPKIEVDASDKSITINGYVGEDNTFVGNLRITPYNTASGSNSLKLTILPSDLKSIQGAEIIGRQQVSLSSDQTLVSETPILYQVKISGVKTPGEYKGRIELLLPGQPRNKSEVIDLTVVAVVRPSLKLLTESDSIKLSLVNCSWGCGLARLILPLSNFQNTYWLQFEKPLTTRTEISDKIFAVKGDKTQFQFAETHLTLSDQTSLPDNSVPSSADQRYITIAATINLSTLASDHYSGAVHISLAGQTTPIKIPVDVNVRVDPLFPLLFLILGLILGRLFKYMQEKGGPKADALLNLNRLRYRLETAHEDDRLIIEPMMQKVNQLINKDQTEQANALIASIEARLVALDELRQIETRLQGKEQHPLVKEIISNLAKAREFIRQEEDDQAKACLSEIHKILITLSTTMMGDEDEGAMVISEIQEKADIATTALNQTESSLAGGASNIFERLKNWLVWLTGVSDEFKSQATLWLLRPLLWLVLILSLAALGMKSLYIDNPIFGVSSFDYLSLIFWGISSDIASRTLSNLKITEAG